MIFNVKDIDYLYGNARSTAQSWRQKIFEKLEAGAPTTTWKIDTLMT